MKRRNEDQTYYASTNAIRWPLRFNLVLAAAILLVTIQPPPTRAIDIKINILDVSPTTDNFPAKADLQHSPSGRVLSLAVSADGGRLYAGTFAGVWLSDDRGATWQQLTRPQPVAGTNDVPGALFVPTVFDLAVAPDNRDVVLAATAFDTREISKSGIYRGSLLFDGSFQWALVHQFHCSNGGNVSQIVFAPDDPKIVFATGGCAIAKSTNGGVNWDELQSFADLGGEAWHVAVGPQKASIPRVYAAGTNQFFYSEDGGKTWSQDKAGIIPNMGKVLDPTVPQKDKDALSGDVGTFPDLGGASTKAGNSSQVLVVEPDHPERVYVVVPTQSNGPAYYFPITDEDGNVIGHFPDGENCEQRIHCGGAAVWLGDYSTFQQFQQRGNWRRLASPPAYFGVSTGSGRVYVVTKRTQSGYLLFLSDGTHVHVSQGPPEHSASWHRLDGRDASESKRDRDRTNPPNDGELANKLFVHVDPHALVVSPDFDITLKVSDLSDPFNQNSELKLFSAGTIWMANDGGVYRSTDGGMNGKESWQLLPGLPLLLYSIQSRFAGLALAGKPTGGPALYFGVPDNDDFFTLDGGRTWNDDPREGCGDCQPYFSDPLQPNRVLKTGRFDLSFIYDSSSVSAYPDPRKDLQRRICLPAGSSILLGGGYSKGYNPIVPTALGEVPSSDGDYLLIREINDPTNVLHPIRRVLLRTRNVSQIQGPPCTNLKDWDSTSNKVSQLGPDLPSNDIDVVQASGGHDITVFYVGNGAQVWRLTSSPGGNVWQPIVDGHTLIARRFFVHPYEPNVIYIISELGIRRSDDFGQSWHTDMNLDRAVTENGRFSYLGAARGVPVISAMVFDHLEMGTRFAIGNAGVFFTLDGTAWERLLSTTALPAYPVAAYFDGISDPLNRALYVALSGRGILRISPIPEIVNDQFPQPSVKTSPPVPGGGPAGTFIITAMFTNHSSTPIVSPFFQVIELSGGNLLLNADGGVPGGVGATLTPSDDFLPAGKSFTVNFDIGLQTRQRFTFKVNLIGVKTE